MSKPFHVYLDLDVFNNSTDFTKKPPQLSFEETRTQPFLDGTAEDYFCLLYTSPSPRDRTRSRMPSSA